MNTRLPFFIILLQSFRTTIESGRPFHFFPVLPKNEKENFFEKRTGNRIWNFVADNKTSFYKNRKMSNRLREAIENSFGLKKCKKKLIVISISLWQKSFVWSIKNHNQFYRLYKAKKNLLSLQGFQPLIHSFFRHVFSFVSL